MLFLNWTNTSDPGMPTRAEVADGFHWNLWKTRQVPFADLSDGAEIVLVDSWPSGGRLTWVVRAKDVVASPYATKDEAVRLVARGLGLQRSVVRSHGYTAGRPDAGYVLAWSPRPVRRLDLPRPDDMTFLRNGWLRVDDPVVLRRWGLAGGQPAAAQPRPRRSPIGHGRLGVAERVAVEDHAMRRAEAWCRQHGWPIVEDVSRQSSWDLEARKRKGGRVLFVEVKGTTGSKVDVEVTAAEVRHARMHPGDTVLIVITEIRLKRGAHPTASGGRIHVVNPWDPTDSELTTTRYRWRPSRGNAP